MKSMKVLNEFCWVRLLNRKINEIELVIDEFKTRQVLDF